MLDMYPQISLVVVISLFGKTFTFFYWET